MKSTFNLFTRIGFIFSGLAVAAGAFGSHLLKDIIPDNDFNVFETAVKYQFFHSLAIVCLSLNYRKLSGSILFIALILFVVGIIIFSGSLYALSTLSIWGGNEYKYLGAITPLGGTAFILGWFLLVFKGFSNSNGAETTPIDFSHTHNSGKHHRSHSKNSFTKNTNETGS